MEDSFSFVITQLARTALHQVLCAKAPLSPRSGSVSASRRPPNPACHMSQQLLALSQQLPAMLDDPAKHFQKGDVRAIAFPSPSVRSPLVRFPSPSSVASVSLQLSTSPRVPRAAIVNCPGAQGGARFARFAGWRGGWGARGAGIVFLTVMEEEDFSWREDPLRDGGKVEEGRRGWMGKEFFGDSEEF